MLVVDRHAEDDMARRLREDFIGARHHIWARGVRRGLIFTTDQSREFFLELVAVLATDFGIEVHAYALMDNHYHLMVESKQGRLSAAMQWLNSTYARWFNLHTGWEGAVLSTRFGNKIVDDDLYWAHLLAYIHLNPVRAGMVSRPEDARWTSMAAYLNEEDRPEWLRNDCLLELHGGPMAHLGYVRSVQAGRLCEPEGFREMVYEPLAFQERRAVREAQRPLKEAVEELDALDFINLQGFKGPGGKSDWNRILLSWWLYTTTRASLEEVGAALEINKSTVRRRVHKLERALEKSQGASHPGLLLLHRLQGATAR